MLEYGHPNMAAAAIYGLHGWEVGSRDLEVTLLDREVIAPTQSDAWRAAGISSHLGN